RRVNPKIVTAPASRSRLPCNMAQSLQGDLFEDQDSAENPRVDMAAFDHAIDHRLGEPSWITHLPGLIVRNGRIVTELSSLGGAGSSGGAGCTTVGSTSRASRPNMSTSPRRPR